MTTLAATGLSVDRGANRLLDDVSLTATAGELVCIAGPNGAGKSTLLAALAGDLAPATGRVTIANRTVGAIRTAELARLRAVLPQQHRVAFGFTARDVIEMGCAPHAGNDADHVAATIERLDVGPILDRPFRVLSGGEQARVALARILVQNTPILLLDEPTAALDLRHQELVMALARREADDGRTVMAVVHDLNLAAAHADRILILAAGRVLTDGQPDAVLDAATLERAYGIAVTVTTHPTRHCPLVLTTGGL
jgi:iron complex transport system ATP-binding protein